MVSPSDLAAEHARLVKELAEIRRLIVAEWPTMDAVTAQYRQRRTGEIQERLDQIERTKAWKGRDV